MLCVSEIFYSIQGESTMAGCPCVFIRLTGCNLNCSYCDTEGARSGGRDMEVEGIVAEVERFNCRLVEVTGGEPLLQMETASLLEKLAGAGFEVLLETNGSVLLPENRGWRVIMDIKCPGSGMEDSFVSENLERLKEKDEIKFVISGRPDFDWARRLIRNWGLVNGGREIIMSPVHDRCSPADLAEWILRETRSVRLQLQLHKLIWPNLSSVTAK